MTHPNPAPPDSNGPSTAHSRCERQGTGPLCVCARNTRGVLQPYWLEQHICTISDVEWPPLATDVNCMRARRVLRAEEAGEWPVMAGLCESCILH